MARRRAERIGSWVRSGRTKDALPLLARVRLGALRRDLRVRDRVELLNHRLHGNLFSGARGERTLLGACRRSPARVAARPQRRGRHGRKCGGCSKGMCLGRRNERKGKDARLASHRVQRRNVHPARGVDEPRERHSLRKDLVDGVEVCHDALIRGWEFGRSKHGSAARSRGTEARQDYYFASERSSQEHCPQTRGTGWARAMAPEEQPESSSVWPSVTPIPWRIMSACTVAATCRAPRKAYPPVAADAGASPTKASLEHVRRYACGGWRRRGFTVRERERRDLACLLAGLAVVPLLLPSTHPGFRALFALPHGFWLVVPRIPSLGVRVGAPICGERAAVSLRQSGGVRWGLRCRNAPMTCAPAPRSPSGSGSPRRYSTCGDSRARAAGSGSYDVSPLDCVVGPNDCPRLRNFGCAWRLDPEPPWSPAVGERVSWIAPVASLEVDDPLRRIGPLRIVLCWKSDRGWFQNKNRPPRRIQIRISSAVTHIERAGAVVAHSLRRAWWGQLNWTPSAARPRNRSGNNPTQGRGCLKQPSQGDPASENENDFLGRAPRDRSQ